MPRVARVVVPGLPHHVTQRGNNRSDVFFTDSDRALYLNMLREEASTRGVVVEAYCLMANHVHLVLTPRTADGLKLAVGRTHWRYSQAINRLHGRSGHLWQGRFHSCPMEDAHLVAAVCYVERNPVRARMVREARRYRWSSAEAHCGGKDKAGLVDAQSWRRRATPKEWERLLRAPGDGAIVAGLRSATRTGRPLASDSLLSKLEARLGRRLRALPRGRPAKLKKASSVKRETKRRGKR